MPKGDKKRPTIHRHSQSNDPTGISAKGLAPMGISSGIQAERTVTPFVPFNKNQQELYKSFFF